MRKQMKDPLLFAGGLLLGISAAMLAARGDLVSTTFSAGLTPEVGAGSRGAQVLDPTILRESYGTDLDALYMGELLWSQVPSERAYLLRAHLFRLIEAGRFDEAFGLIDTAPPKDREELTYQVYSHWAMSDPIGAWEHIMQHQSEFQDYISATYDAFMMKGMGQDLLTRTFKALEFVERKLHRASEVARLTRSAIRYDEALVYDIYDQIAGDSWELWAFTNTVASHYDPVQMIATLASRESTTPEAFSVLMLRTSETLLRGNVISEANLIELGKAALHLTGNTGNSSLDKSHSSTRANLAGYLAGTQPELALDLYRGITNQLRYSSLYTNVYENLPLDYVGEALELSYEMNPPGRRNSTQILYDRLLAAGQVTDLSDFQAQYNVPDSVMDQLTGGPGQ